MHLKYFFFISFLVQPTGLSFARLTLTFFGSLLPDARLNLLSFNAQWPWMKGFDIYWSFSGWLFFSVTIVEKEKIDGERKVLTITDKFRTVEKILSCVTLEDFLLQGKRLKVVDQVSGRVTVAQECFPLSRKGIDTCISLNIVENSK